MNTSTTRGRRVFAGVFCLGVYAVLTQVLLTRELLTVFNGNELIIGTILGCWLTAIGLGAALGRALIRARWFDRGAIAVWCALFAVIGLALPCQMMAVRLAHAVAGVPAGEYAPYRVAFWTAWLVCLPSCVPIGFAFPLSTGLAARQAVGSRAADDGGLAVTWVYLWEAVGGMLGGAVLTFVLLRVLGPVQLAAVGMGVAFVGAALLAPGRIVRRAGVLAAGAVLVVAAVPGLHVPLAEAASRVRWRSLGALAAVGRDGPRLVLDRDTVYQNLTVTELGGQYALYGNGELAFTFPDAYADEFLIHVVMAQNPHAASVLLLGGNPLGEIPELLKYPLGRLVSVDLDPGVWRTLAELLPDRAAAVAADRRVTHVTGDAVTYLRTCTESFDVVLVRAPPPATAGANRFYTVEFYRRVRRVLTPRGFLYTAVSASERLQDEAAALTASVRGALDAVFPRVLITAGWVNHCFAGGADSVITLDADTLYTRSRATPVPALYFQPEYLLGWDDISPDKVAYVRERLAAVDAPINTALRPAAYLRNLVLWFRFSGGDPHGVLPRVLRLDVRRALGVVFMGGCAILAAGLLVGRAARRGHGAGRGWARAAVLAGVGLTGCGGLAAELALVFVLQSVYGVVYTHMGLIVAVFMLGLVAGAPLGHHFACRGETAVWRGFAATITGLLLLTLAVRGLATGLVTGVDGLAPAFGFGLIYGLTACCGAAVGAAFPLANAAALALRSTPQHAAAATDSADHLGGAVGAFLTGTLLLPVLGIAGACLVLAALQGLALVCVLCAALVAAAGRGDPT